MITDFVRISEEEWCLTRGIDQRRRQRLLRDTTFEGIVDRITENATISFHKRERFDSQQIYRVLITLEMDAAIVDLFYNSVSGYRAQYYYSVENGERANDYAVKRLTPRIKELLTEKEKSTCPWWWVERSLLSPGAKLWIHQGRWLRIAKRADRNICAWMNRQGSCPATSGERKLIWGSLSPKDETRIDVKGVFLTLTGTPKNKRLKPRRGKDIHDFGFT